MQCTIVAIKRTPRISKKTNKPFVSVGIKTDQHGEKWLSGFANTENADWESGTVVDIDVEEKNNFLNFSTPKHERREDQGPAAGNPATAEIKNMINLQVMPILERNNAGIQKLELLIKALGDRLEYLTKKGAGEEEEIPEPEF